SNTDTSNEQEASNESDVKEPETPQQGHIRVAQTDFVVNEKATKLDITLSRVDGKDGELSIQYETFSLTANTAQDYWYAQGDFVWEDQDASDKVLEIYIKDDAERENSEQFQVKFIDDAGLETVVTIEIISDELPTRPDIAAVCRPENRQINETCSAESHELFNLQSITTQGNISEAILSTEIINNGRVSNSVLTENATLYGGIISGSILSQGLMCDFEFRGSGLAGGVLCGNIINSSAEQVHGVIQDVILASDTYLRGGELAGHIQGTASSPALIENVFVHEDSKLSDVVIGQKVFFDRNVILENVGFTHQVDYLENVTLQGIIVGHGEQHLVLKNGKIAEDAELIGIEVTHYQ
ncbi:MAG: Calx-beta domain-containing protein, partial [Thiotrichaceae bacterium]|nr:Calx-beta domain-containing protein [Thiotrichaceae bacterium]